MFDPWLVSLGLLVTLIIGIVIGRYSTRRIHMDLPPSSDLVLITHYYKHGGSFENVVMRGHVNRLVEALLELYHKPGINPHTEEETSKIFKITLREQKGEKISGLVLESSGPYWGTTPGLMKNYDPCGAKVFEVSDEPGLLWGEETIIKSLQPA